MKINFLTTVFLLCIIASSFAEELSPQAILQKTAATYASLETYKTNGKMSTTVEINGEHVSLGDSRTEFTLLLKKPNIYLMTMSLSNQMGAEKTSVATWNDGSLSYLCINQDRKTPICSKGPSNTAALDILRSSAGSYIVAAVFFNLPEIKSPLERWTSVVREADEQVDGVDCYVLGAGSSSSEQETVWISKANFLILKHHHSDSHSLKTRIKTPEITDEVSKGPIESTGQMVAEEHITWKEPEPALFNRVSQTDFSNIASPVLEKKDFEYQAPEGTVWKDSPYDKEEKQ